MKSYITQKVHNNQGFTIIELMIATMVFSVILLLCAAGLIQIGRHFQKGITISRTQESARTTVEEVTESLQFGGGYYRRLDTLPNNVEGYCVGNKRFSYIRNREQSQSPSGVQVRRALVVDVADCNTTTEPRDILASGAGRLLLGDRMRITTFDIDEAGPDSTYRVRVRIASGDNTLFDGSGNCQSGPGSSFCAVSEIDTVVQRRL